MAQVLRRVLTAPAVDSHNSFDQPHAVEPTAFAGHVRNGALLFELPARSVAVVKVE